MQALPAIDKTTVLRTPAARFAHVRDFPWLPKFVEVGGLSIAYIDEDELVEVTPGSIRLRKIHLDPHDRKRASRSKAA